MSREEQRTFINRNTSHLISPVSGTPCFVIAFSSVGIHKLCYCVANLIRWVKALVIYGDFLILPYSTSDLLHVFFSPGATTPNGGCILQPSSGL